MTTSELLIAVASLGVAAFGIWLAWRAGRSQRKRPRLDLRVELSDERGAHAEISLSNCGDALAEVTSFETLWRGTRQPLRAAALGDAPWPLVDWQIEEPRAGTVLRQGETLRLVGVRVWDTFLATDQKPRVADRVLGLEFRVGYRGPGGEAQPQLQIKVSDRSR